MPRRERPLVDDEELRTELGFAPPASFWKLMAEPGVSAFVDILWSSPAEVLKGNRSVRSVPGWPTCLLAVGDDGDGGTLAIDPNLRNSPVYEWRDEYGDHVRCFARSVEDCVLTYIRGYLYDGDKRALDLPAPLRERAVDHRPSSEHRLDALAMQFNRDRGWSEEGPHWSRAHSILAVMLASIGTSGLVASVWMGGPAYGYGFSIALLIAAFRMLLQAISVSKQARSEWKRSLYEDWSEGSDADLHEVDAAKPRRKSGASVEIWSEIRRYLVDRGFSVKGSEAIRKTRDLDQVILFDSVSRGPNYSTFTLYLTVRSHDVIALYNAWVTAAGEEAIPEYTAIFNENVGGASGGSFKQWEVHDDVQASALAGEAIAMLERAIDAFTSRYGSLASIAAACLDEPSPVAGALRRAAVLVVAGRLDDALPQLMAARHVALTSPNQVYPGDLQCFEAAIADVQRRQKDRMHA